MVWLGIIKQKQEFILTYITADKEECKRETMASAAGRPWEIFEIGEDPNYTKADMVSWFVTMGVKRKEVNGLIQQFCRLIRNKVNKIRNKVNND